MEYNFDNERPIYIQLVDIIRTDIVSGKLKKGERMPSVRELALNMKVNPNTMQKYRSGQLQQLPPTTLNKLYVALTRAHGNLYMVEEKIANQLETKN